MAKKIVSYSMEVDLTQGAKNRALISRETGNVVKVIVLGSGKGVKTIQCENPDEARTRFYAEIGKLYLEGYTHPNRKEK